MLGTRRPASSTNARNYSGLDLALQQTHATYDIALEREAAEEDSVCEAVRHTLSHLCRHTLDISGAKPLVRPPESKNILRNVFVSKRYDLYTKDCNVRLCAEMHTRWQMQQALNSLGSPALETQLIDAMLYVDEHCFFQLGRPGIVDAGAVSDWQVDTRRPEPYELFSLARLPSASRICVAALRSGSENISPLIDDNGRLVRRTTTQEISNLLGLVVAAEQEEYEVRIFAAHFCFFAAIALMAQHDLTTLSAENFFRVWRFPKSFNLFDKFADKSLYPMLSRLLMRTPSEMQLACAMQLKDEVSAICERFEQLTVAYQN